MSALNKNSNKNIDTSFKLNKLNEKFLSEDRKVNSEIYSEIKYIDKTKYVTPQEYLNYLDYNDLDLKPHYEYNNNNNNNNTNFNIIISMHDLFFKIMEMVLNKQNPLPYIFKSNERHLHFSLLLLLFGVILLLISTLL